MKKLDEKAVLVQLTAKSVGNTKKDVEITSIVLSDYGITDGNGSFSKKLYGEFIAPVGTASAALRKFFNEKTYPWSGKQRLCPLVDENNPKRLFFKEFEDKVRELIGEYDRAVATFLDKVRDGSVEADARNRLGRAFKDDDYTGADEMAEKFGIIYEVNPVPSDDIRVGFSAEMEQSIREKVNTQNKAHFAEVSLAVLNDARNLVHILLEKIQDDTTAIKAEVIQKIQSQMEHFRAFPVTGEAETILSTVDGAIRKFSAAAIVGNPAVRGYVKSQVEALDKQLNPVAPTVVETPVASRVQTTMDAVEVSTGFPEVEAVPEKVLEIPVPAKKKGKKSIALGDVPVSIPVEVDYEAQLAALESQMAGAV
jgi:hypothetical protein